MILVDISNLFYSNLFAYLRYKKDEPLEIGMLRHMILNSLRVVNSKFRNEYGELIVCVDSNPTWRHQIFPHYKHGRSKARQAHDVNWPQLYNWFSTIKAEIQTYFPYKVIQVPLAEADDIIATIVKNCRFDQILIVSCDEDFGQLHIYPNVKQYDHIKKKMVIIKAPYKFLLEHIIEGDSSDAIPNCLSDDNVFIENRRQTPLTAKKREILKSCRVDDYMAASVGEPNLIKYFNRNFTLISLDEIPVDLQVEIMKTYQEAPSTGRNEMFKYFIDKKLKMLMSNIQDF